VNNAEGDMERLREDKDQEILVLEEGMNDTIQRLKDAQQVTGFLAFRLPTSDNLFEVTPRAWRCE
jgi:hypothetical protein